MDDPLRKKITPRLKLDGFVSEEREEIVSMVENIVKEKVFISILEKLSHEEKEELGAMSEGEYQEKLEKFLEPRFAQFQKIIDISLDDVVGEFNAMRT